MQGCKFCNPDSLEVFQGEAGKQFIRNRRLLKKTAAIQPATFFQNVLEGERGHGEWDSGRLLKGDDLTILVATGRFERVCFGQFLAEGEPADPELEFFQLHRVVCPILRWGGWRSSRWSGSHTGA